MAEEKKMVTFFKMEATGNDFVLFDASREKSSVLPSRSRIRQLCDRHFGIGADGALLLLQGRETAFAMRIFNPDGSEAESCGNGIACISKLVYERYRKKRFFLETRGGRVQPSIFPKKRGVEVEIDMGMPVMDASQIPVRRKEADGGKLFTLRVQNRSLKVGCVSMGNPHCLIVSPLKEEAFFALAPHVETDALFPKKTNVHLLRRRDKGMLDLLIWERGAGRTLSCGTGACAAFALALRHGWVEKRATVVVPGGRVKLKKKKENIILGTAPHTVFTGKTELF